MEIFVGFPASLHKFNTTKTRQKPSQTSGPLSISLTPGIGCFWQSTTSMVNCKKSMVNLLGPVRGIRGVCTAPNKGSGSYELLRSPRSSDCHFLCPLSPPLPCFNMLELLSWTSTQRLLLSAFGLAYEYPLGGQSSVPKLSSMPWQFAMVGSDDGLVSICEVRVLVKDALTCLNHSCKDFYV